MILGWFYLGVKAWKNGIKGLNEIRNKSVFTRCTYDIGCIECHIFIIDTHMVPRKDDTNPTQEVQKYISLTHLLFMLKRLMISFRIYRAYRYSMCPNISLNINRFNVLLQTSKNFGSYFEPMLPSIWIKTNKEKWVQCCHQCELWSWCKSMCNPKMCIMKEKNKDIWCEW